MRTKTPFPLATLVRCMAVLVLTLAALGPLVATQSTLAQDEAASDPLEQIAALVPADAAMLFTVSTTTESAQWEVAANLLEQSGLDELVYAGIEDGLADSGIARANFDPESSSILGGAIAVAFWGESPDLTTRGAVYIPAADPESAFRSVVAQLFTEFADEVVESDVPGGRIATDVDGVNAVLLLGDTVVVSGAEGAQSVMRLMMGSGPTLADFAPFQTVIEEQAADSIARAWLNGPALGQDLIPLLSAAGLGWQEIAVLSIGATATSGYTSLGLTAADDGFHVRAVQLPAPLTVIELPTDAPDDDPAERVSADVDVLATGTDLGTNPVLVQFVNSVVFGVSAGWAPYDPAGPTTPDEAYAGFEAATGIDLREEIFDQLQGDFTFAMTFSSFERISDVDAVLVSEVADREAANDTLNQLVGALRFAAAREGPEVSFSEIALGKDILYVLSVVDGASRNEIAFTFGLIEDELVLSLGRGYGRLLLPDEGASLTGDSRYRAARVAASEENGPVAYIDLHDLIELGGIESFMGVAGQPVVSLDGIQALAAVTYDRGDLVITDVVLTVDDAPADAGDDHSTPTAGTPGTSLGEQS